MVDGPWTDIVARANAAARQPVLFIPDQARPLAWDGWAKVFENAGYAALTPSWPSGNAEPASQTITDLVERFAEMAQALNDRPAVIGHGFGGLIAQVLAGNGLSPAAVAVAPLQGAARTLNPAVRAGALLVMAGKQDQTVPLSAARAIFAQQQQRRSDAVSEFAAFAGRGHTLTTGTGWPELAETALRFVQRFV